MKEKLNVAYRYNLHNNYKCMDTLSYCFLFIQPARQLPTLHPHIISWESPIWKATSLWMELGHHMQITYTSPKMVIFPHSSCLHPLPRPTVPYNELGVHLAVIQCSKPRALLPQYPTFNISTMGHILNVFLQTFSRLEQSSMGHIFNRSG